MYPAGLVNLGNTCYLNSSIQCLRRSNELKDFLLKAKNLSTSAIEGKLAFSFQRLLNFLEKKGEAVTPNEFVNVNDFFYFLKLIFFQKKFKFSNFYFTFYFCKIRLSWWLFPCSRKEKRKEALSNRMPMNASRIS